MKKINTRRLYYHIRHKYFTLNNAVIVLAFAIAAGWVWGSLGVLQRNYTLQKQVDDKQQQLLVAQLDTETAQLQQRYYQTPEYQELAARQDFGLANPGESVLILPPNSQAAINADQAATTSESASSVGPPVGNFEQWMNFLFGGNSAGAAANS
jgi:cell division protein FtsB